MSKPQPKIAVIGPSQSGKTCLATGLSNVGRHGLKVHVPDSDIKGYLKEHTRELGNQKWPEATNPGTDKEIRLKFLARGQATMVSFPEFAGELLADDEKFTAFANSHFRGLDGVALLVNPGAAAFRPRESRDAIIDYKTQYEKIIAYLGDPNNGAKKPIVALVVTAADRLQGDLKDGDAEGPALFRECLEGIENDLTARGFDWKRHDVTVTGHLDDQEKPKLARGSEITAAEPFLWLVDRITDYPERVKKRKFWAIIAALAAVLALMGGCWFHLARNDREEQLLDKCKDALEACSKGENTDPKPEIIKAAKEAMSDLRSHPWANDEHKAKADELLKQYGGEVDRARCEHAVRYPDLHELARLLDEAQTNTNLAGWTNRLEGAFGIAYENFLVEVATNTTNRPGVPKVMREDENKIRQKANEIGPRFDANKALEALRQRVEEFADPQRAACLKWKQENIRSSCPRTGPNGLLRKYLDASGLKMGGKGELKGNPFLSEIVRTAVYDQYGRWLEEDVANYPSKVTVALFDGEKGARDDFEQWLKRFRETCLELADTDDPDPDKSSWAYQFAKRAVEEKRFPEKPWDAFPQTFVITRIACRVDYGGKFPTNHKRTSLKASLRVLDPEGEPGKPIPVMDGGDIRKEDENKWVTVWTNGFSHKAGLFTMALHLDVVDEQNLAAKIFTLGGSRNIVFPLADVPVAALKLHKAKDKQDCWEFEQEINLGRNSGADKVRCSVRVYGKLERKTPGSLGRDLWNEGKWRRPAQEGMAR